MAFSIFVDSHTRIDSGKSFVEAYFTLGTDAEPCSLPVDYWTTADYIHQWILAITHVTETQLPGALVTSIHNPLVAANIVAWVLYPLLEEIVVIQQRLLSHDAYIDNRIGFRYDLLPNRENFEDDLEPVSEWIVNMADLMKVRSELSRFKSRSEE